MLFPKPKTLVEKFLGGASAASLAPVYEVSESKLLRVLRKDAEAAGKSAEVEERLRLNQLRVLEEYRVGMLDESGRVIKEFDTAKEAAKHFGILPYAIRYCVDENHPKQRASGHRWVRL